MINNKSVKEELYSENQLHIHTIDSLITHDRVFVGNQTDDFAVAKVLQNSQRILLLGVGYGGALRPLLIGNSSVEITAVDLNPLSIKISTLIFDEYFPALSRKINFIHKDALEYLKEFRDTPFDAICIDLYRKSDYPKFVLTCEFWELIINNLTPKGAVLFNSWGLPQQLRPLEGGTIQQRVAQLICKHFKNVRVLPHRRNITFLAYQHHKLEEPKQKFGYPLRNIDKIIFQILPHRLKYALEIKLEKLDDKHFRIPNNTTEEIDREMYSRWSHLINVCNFSLHECGLSSINEISELAYDPLKARILTEYLLVKESDESSLIPVLIGAYAFEQPKGLEWYLQWMTEDAEKLMKLNAEWFINTALWQLLAMTANPYAHFEHWADDIQQLVTKLNLTNPM
ncbi:hypothetical protein BS11774_19805 [Bacillus subtilis]|uniref:spermidine synthase n=1 Tax=Bacillus subtilis TaxID=1423 RepID=UPI000FF8BB2F|nr:hypothetical protein [Bacillus subtilis]QAR62547.1 hypothetical protein BS11774_19805 [Bacillus subtilis]